MTGKLLTRLTVMALLIVLTAACAGSPRGSAGDNR